MTPAHPLVDDFRDLARRVRYIRAHDRLRPHAFTEDKDELAHRIDRLTDRLAELLPSPPAPKPRTGRVLPALHPA